jgi:hypothetical protein
MIKAGEHITPASVTSSSKKELERKGCEEVVSLNSSMGSWDYVKLQIYW